MFFGEIDSYIIFGGGELLLRITEHLKNISFPVFVVTSRRHAEEYVTFDNITISFANHLTSAGIEFIVASDITNNPKIVERITPNTMGLSFGAAWIFRDEFISRFNGNLINFHGTRLPQDRGGGGFSWRIMRRDRTGMSLIHQVDPGVDTGDIVMCEEYIFPPDCRYPIDYQRYSIMKTEELSKRFFQLVAEQADFQTLQQQEAFSSYWPRLSTDINGYIDWSWNLLDIESFICAFDDPYAGASTFLDGKKVRIKKCAAFYGDGAFHPFQNGIIYRISQSAAFVAKEGGALIIQNIYDESGNDLISKLTAGKRLYTPIKFLEAAQVRVVYSPEGFEKFTFTPPLENYTK